MSSEYQRRLRVWDHLYASAGDVGDPCTYCGCTSTGFDHVPPLHMTDRMRPESRLHTNFRLFPACRECNAWLGGQIIGKVERRRRWVRQQIRRKYRKILKLPDWDDGELAQVSNKLQVDIRAHLRFKQGLLERLHWRQ